MGWGGADQGPAAEVGAMGRWLVSLPLMGVGEGGMIRGRAGEGPLASGMVGALGVGLAGGRSYRWLLGWLHPLLQ